MTIIPPEYLLSLKITKDIAASLSCLGGLLIILIYVLNKELHEVSMKLVMILGVSELIKAIISLINQYRFNTECEVVGVFEMYAAYAFTSCVFGLAWATHKNCEEEEHYVQKRIPFLLLLQFVIIPIPLALL